MEWELVTKIENDFLSEHIVAEGILKYWKKLAKTDFIYCFQELDYDIFYKVEIRKRFQKFLGNNIEIIAKYLKESIMLYNHYLRYCDKYKNIDWKKKSEKELSEIFTKWVEEYKKVGAVLPFPFEIEIILAKLVKSELKKKVSSTKFKTYFSVLQFSEKETEMIKEKKELLKLALKKKNGKLLANHQKKYGWLNIIMLLNEPYTKEHYVKRVKEIENPKKELKRLKELKRKDAIKYKQVIKEIRPDRNFSKLIKYMQEIIFFRDWRFGQLNKGNSFMQKMLKEIAAKLKISYNDILYLSPEEIKKGLKEKKVNKKIIARRQKAWGIILDKGKIETVEGENVKKLKEKLIRKKVLKEKEFKGTIASRGVAKGKVKIVLDKSQLSKVRKGDVLVAEMTTPDYVIAMEKASAIITDIGGLTCHAAIISRELGIPCVIGTKVATKVLKDGDMVEVDANKGIVRKLK